MNNNDVLRKIRYAFDLKDREIADIFQLNSITVSVEDIKKFLQKEDSQTFKKCSDSLLNSFLDGFIIQKRGPKEDGKTPPPELPITNNAIFRKLKIALNLKSDETLDILALADVQISNAELSSLFRKKGHRNYKECGDRYLRNFLKGIAIKEREND